MGKLEPELRVHVPWSQGMSQTAHAPKDHYDFHLFIIEVIPVIWFGNFHILVTFFINGRAGGIFRRKRYAPQTTLDPSWDGWSSDLQFCLTF